jgi:hypothetical protein
MHSICVSILMYRLQDVQLCTGKSEIMVCRGSGVK